MKKLVYMNLYIEMVKAGWTPSSIAIEMDCAPYTICRKMKGTREWKLWECLEIKRIIGSSMPIEELFKVG